MHSLALVQESFCSVNEMTLPFSESHQNVVRLATFWSEIFMPLSDTHGLPSHLTHVTYPGYPYRLGRGKGCFHCIWVVQTIDNMIIQESKHLDLIHNLCFVQNRICVDRSIIKTWIEENNRHTRVRYYPHSN